MNIIISMKDGSEQAVAVTTYGTLANGDLSYRTSEGQRVRVKASVWAGVEMQAGA